MNSSNRPNSRHTAPRRAASRTVTAPAAGSRTEMMSLDRIRIDPAIQCREAMDVETVDAYAEAMSDGVTFPAVVVFSNDKDNVLADGFHRVAGARKAGIDEILVEIRAGTPRDALLHAAGANAKHGLRRTNGDKRRAVLAVLTESEWSEWSDRHVGKICGVSEKTVARYRPEVQCGNSASNSRKFRTRYGSIARRPVDRQHRKATPAAVAPASSNARPAKKRNLFSDDVVDGEMVDAPSPDPVSSVNASVPAFAAPTDSPLHHLRECLDAALTGHVAVLARTCSHDWLDRLVHDLRQFADILDENLPRKAIGGIGSGAPSQ